MMRPAGSGLSASGEQTETAFKDAGGGATARAKTAMTRRRATWVSNCEAVSSSVLLVCGRDTLYSKNRRRSGRIGL